MMMKRKTFLDLIKYIPEFVSVAVLFIFAAMFLLSPQKGFSENENRVLSSCPVPSVESIFDHSFMDSFEDFVSDQFPLRDDLLSLSVRFSRTEGKKVINKVIYVPDEDGNTRLIDEYKKPVNADKFIDAVGRLGDGITSADITVMLVPTAYWFYENEMPGSFLKTDRPMQQDTFNYMRDGIKDLSSEINMVEDIYDSLCEGQDLGLNLFYRTDHHWTTGGAYMGYLALAPCLKLPEDRELLSKTTSVTDSFYGTTWSKVVDYSVSPDTIDIYESPQWKDHITVTYEDTGECFDTPYNMDYLDKKDKYSVFLNNQHSLITIKNNDPDLQRTDGTDRHALVVIKDSYANSLIPFLIDQYETIWVFDPRYYRGSITEWVNDHPEVKDVLVLYNLSTMDSDRGVGAIY